MNQENKLIVQDEISNEDFKLLVNNASQMTNKPNFPDLVKFDAVDGVWLRSAGKDDKDKTVFKPLGKEIEVHIVNNRKTAQVIEGDKTIGWSREVQDNFFEITFTDGHTEKGVYKQLKEKYGDALKYTIILYAFLGEDLVRIKLNGGKLSKWFDYTKSFVGDAIACWMTKFSCGQFIEKTKMVKYFEINVEKGKDISTDRPLIVKHINECNNYLSAYAQSLKKTEEVETEIVPAEEPFGETNVDNIQF